MSVGSISSGSSPYSANGSSAMNQRMKDFQALGQALQSGNLTSAQSAFAALQQNLSQTSQSSSGQGPLAANSAASKDVQSIQSALQSGDISGAQKAFTQLKTDLQSSQKAHGGHHHGHHAPAVNDGDGDANDASAASSSTPAPGSTSTSSPTGTPAATSLADILSQLIGGAVNQQA